MPMQANGLKLLEISSDKKNMHGRRTSRLSRLHICLPTDLHKKGKPLNATFVRFQVSSARLPWQRALVLSPVTLETAMAGMQAGVGSVRICQAS